MGSPRKCIVVVDYDPVWAERFEELRARTWPVLGDLATEIEHVGSTSVPGLAAKPVIDMTIAVREKGAMASVIERLGTIDYRHRGDLGVTGREAFDAPDHLPEHHLYACVQGDLGLRNHLAIRDHLRLHPERARAYGALKKELAARFANDIDRYIDGKTEFLLGVLADAGFSEEELAVIQGINRLPGDASP